MLLYNIGVGYKPVFFGTVAIFDYVCAPFCIIFDHSDSLQITIWPSIGPPVQTPIAVQLVITSSSKPKAEMACSGLSATTTALRPKSARLKAMWNIPLISSRPSLFPAFSLRQGQATPLG